MVNFATQAQPHGPTSRPSEGPWAVVRRGSLFLLLLITLIAFAPSLSANEAAPSVESRIEQAQDRMDSDAAEALRLTREALERAHEQGDEAGEALARLTMAEALESLGGLDEGIVQVNQALDYYRQSDDPDGAAKALNLRGSLLHVQGNYGDALASFQEAYELLIETDDLIGQAKALNNLGRVHYVQDDFDRALEYFERSRERHAEADNLEGVGRQLNNIGVIYRHREDYERALESYQESIAIRRETGNLRDMAGTYNNIGVIHFIRGDYEKSLEWAHRALEVRREVGYRLGEAQSLYNIGRTLVDIGREAEGVEYFHESLAITEEIGALQLSQITYFDLSEALSDLGDYERALNSLYQAWEIRDERFDLERQREMEAMNVRFETAEREREITLLREQKRRDALMRNSAIGGSFLLLALVFLVYRSYRIKSHANRAIELRNEELFTLNRIVVAINDGGDFAETLSVLLKQTVDFLEKAERGVILTYDRETHHFRVTSMYGYRYPDASSIELEPGYVVERYTRNGKRIADGVYLHGPLPAIEGYEEMADLDPLGSVIAMTITIDGRIEGFIVLSSSGKSGTFRKDDAQRFTRIRQHAISALTKVRHYDRLREENQRAEEAIHRMRLAEEELKHAAMTDLLTGLPNRRYMVQRLQDEQARSRRSQQSFGLILGDIDHFKALNDSYGHELGDRVLRHVSQLMRSTVREQDIVCRWGGEEFLIMLPDTGKQGTAVVAEKLRSAVASHPYQREEGELGVTMTFGVADSDGKVDPETRIADADQALYEGKARGRNQVVECSDLPRPEAPS